MNFIVIEGKISPKVTRARSRGGRGDSHMEWTGMLVGNLKETKLGVAEAYTDP